MDIQKDMLTILIDRNKVNCELIGPTLHNFFLILLLYCLVHTHMAIDPYAGAIHEGVCGDA